MLVKGLTSRLCCSGSDSVRIRSSRAAAVCLLLLCVLLLTAVIVLCVQIFTNIDLFQTKGKHIMEERDHLSGDRDWLLNKNINLTNERDELIAKNDNLIKQRDQLNQEINEMLKNGWIYHEFSYYYISSGWKSWTESRRYCTDRGGDLIIKQRGTSDDVEDRWKWVDGSTLTSGFWWSGEPNGQRGENCALNNPSRSADYPRNNAFKWVCEKSVLPTLLP
uniref:C-type lectin domain-containing protein n=1 Tax=Sinocyclocheilus rhinocerous TaxID=307959 RepID=A0A673KIA3_9TELE